MPSEHTNEGVDEVWSNGYTRADAHTKHTASPVNFSHFLSHVPPPACSVLQTQTGTAGVSPKGKETIEYILFLSRCDTHKHTRAHTHFTETISIGQPMIELSSGPRPLSHTPAVTL